MKIILTGLFSMLISLCFHTGFAQQFPLTEPDYSKPKLFLQQPSSIVVDTDALSNLFSLSAGQSVDIPLGSFRYRGIVVSKSNTENTAIQSVVIKSTNFIGSVFTFTKIRANGTALFKGRIISREHSDAFELQVQNGQYLLQKKHQLNIINE